MPNLHVIAASVRNERACLPIAEWFVESAKSHGHFTVRLVDLKEINLPLLDEPHHPSQRKYQYVTPRHGAQSCAKPMRTPS